MNSCARSAACVWNNHGNNPNYNASRSVPGVCAQFFAREFYTTDSTVCFSVIFARVCPVSTLGVCCRVKHTNTSRNVTLKTTRSYYGFTVHKQTRTPLMRAVAPPAPPKPENQHTACVLGVSVQDARKAWALARLFFCFSFHPLPKPWPLRAPLLCGLLR